MSVSHEPCVHISADGYTHIGLMNLVLLRILRGFVMSNVEYSDAADAGFTARPACASTV